MVLAQDSFTSSTTNVELSCPEECTGIERIMLAAQGDLQRLMSSFFARPISIKLIYANTSPRAEPASHEKPILQTRQVHLVCSARTVCVATSSITITSPLCERLFLDEKYAVGQLFRQLGVRPQFSLLNVQTREVDGKRELARLYKLETDGICCEIEEVWPDREMFVKGEAWLDEPQPAPQSQTQAEPLLPGARDEFFTFTPHSLDTTPTLPAILEKQAADPVIGQKVAAAYPAPAREGTSATTLEYAEITYSELARLVSYQASVWFDLLSPLLKSKRKSWSSENEKPEAPVIGVLADSSFSLGVTILSLLKLNVTVFLLAPSNSEAALAHLLKTCSVSVLLHEQKYAAISQKAAVECSTYSIDRNSVLKDQQFFNSALPHLSEYESQVLYDSAPTIPVIVHSSGSTSFPKPVRWTNRSFLSNSQIMLTGGGWSAFTQPDNRFLCLGPLFHTMGLTIGMAGSICGGTTIVFPLTKAWPPSPADIVRSLRETAVTTCIIVPLLLEQLVNTLEADGSTKGSKDPLTPLINLRLLITGGAHCPDKLANRLTSRGVNLKSVYGSSETGHLMVGAHERSVPGDNSAWNSVRPFPHTSIILKLVDENAEPSEMRYQVHMAADDVRLAAGVLASGEKTWSTGDVVQEVPAGSGFYKLLYREDDILVHVSGEKTNPIPMEVSCRNNKLIERIAILGHQRPVTCAIIQLNEAEAQRHSEEERGKIVKDAIRTANAAAPSHSRLLDEMTMILPLDYPKQIPRTPKGNCIRPKVLQMFVDEIDRLYRDLEGDSDQSDSDASADWSVVTPVDVQEQVTKIFEGVTDKPLPSNFDANTSLFDIGLDSVSAISLRNSLSKAFGIKLPSQFVYKNFTLSMLSSALHEQVASRTMTPVSSGEPSRRNTLGALLEQQLRTLKASANMVRASRIYSSESPPSAGELVAVVGAAGSLGAWQVKLLLERSDVQKVVCLVRGADKNAVYDKMSAAFSNAGFNDLSAQLEQEWRPGQLRQPNLPAVDVDQRLVVLPFDLACAQIDEKEYLALSTKLTTIIHTGWKMDFNQTVQAFENDCLNGTTQLLLLASFVRPKKFYFISSIGVVMESKSSPVPEAIPEWSNDEHLSVSPHGYSESKFVCEYVVKAASEMFGIPCAIARVGQISGDTAAGVWKTQEMNPIIIAGSARIGKFPVIPGAPLDWTPVDIVGRSTVELAFSSTSSGSTSVHHIVNPRPSTYLDVVEHLQTAGLSLIPVSPTEWWDAIQKDEGNPCLMIESYIEEAVVNPPVTPPTLEIKQTLQLEPQWLGGCPQLDGQLWDKYVRYWRSVKFLPSA